MEKVRLILAGGVQPLGWSFVGPKLWALILQIISGGLKWTHTLYIFGEFSEWLTIKKKTLKTMAP